MKLNAVCILQVLCAFAEGFMREFGTKSLWMKTLSDLKAQLSGFLVSLDNYKVIRTIGKGGFGEVYLAENKETHNFCAIKKLLTNRLEGKQLKYFIREVSILAKCDNMFLLPFSGFTTSYPYSILTQYIPNGSLYDALHHKLNSPLLSPTHKTAIAMGVACGMAHLHEMNIIHRDLKSLNILLDEKYLPKICDFGIARYKMSNNDLVTQEVGTPHWMAPELFESTEYDNKVDVYSYGLLLWEMVAEDTPFKGKSSHQVMTAICKNRERPVIPQNTPPTLRTLIQLCWHQNPADRPTFANIYKLWTKKKVFFEGADLSGIDALARQARKGRKREIPRKQVTVRNAISPLFSTDNIEFITDVNSSTYEQQFEVAIDKLEISKAKDFFDKVKIVFKPDLIPNIMTCILSGFHKLLLRDDEIFNPFVESGLHLMLPFESPEYVDQVFRIMIQALNRDPNIYSADILKKIMVHSESNPRKVIRVLSVAAASYDRLKNPNELADLIFESSSTLINGDGAAALVQMLNFLVASFQDFSSNYLENVEPIFTKAALSNDKALVYEGCAAICANWTPALSPPQEELCKQLLVPETQLPAFSVLLRMEDFVLDDESTIKLLAKIPSITDVGYLICRCCMRQHYAEIVYDCFDSVRNFEDKSIILRILCVMILHDNLRHRIELELSKFMILFTQVVDSGNTEAISLLPHFLNRLNFDSSFSDDIQKEGTALKIVLLSSDTCENIEFAEHLARLCFRPSISAIIPQISSYLMLEDEEVTSQIMDLVLMLAKNEETRGELKNSDVIRALTQRIIPAELENRMFEIMRCAGVSFDDSFGF